MRMMWRVALATGSIIAAAACSSTTDAGDDGNGGATPSITLSLSTGSLNVAQGASGQITATIGRAGGFSGAVTIATEGLPSGVTATATPSSIAAGSTASTIVVTATASAAATTTNITVRAGGSGVTAVTATFSVTITAVVQGGYTLSMNPATLSVQAGAQGTSNVTIMRTGGFTGPVALAVSGQPSGVTPTLNPASTTGSTAALTVAVDASVAAGSYTLTITGTATGLADQMTTLPLTVTSSGGGAGNMTYTFCPASGLPAWLGYQDGTGAWTRVTADASNQYIFNFNVTAARAGVAWVTASGDDSSTLIYYGSQQELSALGIGFCGSDPTAVTKTLNGSVANISATETAYVWFNGGGASVTPAAGTTFQLTGVRDGAGDLIAGRSAQTVSGTGITLTFNAGIIRRGINPANGSTIPVLDFNASEAFTPVARNLTINGVGAGENTSVTTAYVTAGGGTGVFYTEPIGETGGSRTYFGVPTANQENGDLHLISARAFNLAAPTTFRSVTAISSDATDKTVTLGPSVQGLNVASVAGARIRFTYTVQPEYSNLLAFGVGQSAANIGRSITMVVTAGYLAGSTAADFTVPDFSAVAGWNTAWTFVAGAQATWSFSGQGWTTTGGGFGSPFVDGGMMQFVSTVGMITPF